MVNILLHDARIIAAIEQRLDEIEKEDNVRKSARRNQLKQRDIQDIETQNQRAREDDAVRQSRIEADDETRRLRREEDEEWRRCDDTIAEEEYHLRHEKRKLKRGLWEGDGYVVTDPFLKTNSWNGRFTETPSASSASSSSVERSPHQDSVGTGESACQLVQEQNNSWSHSSGAVSPLQEEHVPEDCRGNTNDTCDNQGPNHKRDRQKSEDLVHRPNKDPNNSNEEEIVGGPVLQEETQQPPHTRGDENQVVFLTCGWSGCKQKHFKDVHALQAHLYQEHIIYTNGQSAESSNSKGKAPAVNEMTEDAGEEPIFIREAPVVTSQQQSRKRKISQVDKTPKTLPGLTAKQRKLLYEVPVYCVPDLSSPIAGRLKANLMTAFDGAMRKTMTGNLLEPVDRTLHPDYLEKVKRPMDFGTMTNKLEEDEYKTVREFMDDFELVVRNCRTYYGEHHFLTSMVFNAQELVYTELCSILCLHEDSDDSDFE